MRPGRDVTAPVMTAPLTILLWLLASRGPEGFAGAATAVAAGNFFYSRRNPLS